MNFLAKRGGGGDGGAQHEAFEGDEGDEGDGDDGGEKASAPVSPAFWFSGFLGFLCVSGFLLVFFFPFFLLFLFLFLPFFFWFWDPVLLLSRVIYVGFHKSVFMEQEQQQEEGEERTAAEEEEDDAAADKDIQLVRTSIHNLLLVYVAYFVAMGYFFSLFYKGEENFTRFYFDSFMLVCGENEKPRYAVKDDGDGEAAIINDLLERNHNLLFEQKFAVPFSLGNVISYSFIPISCSRICFVNLGVFLELVLGKNKRVIFLVLFFLSYLSLFSLFSLEASLTDAGLACALPLIFVFMVLDYVTIFLNFAKEIRDATSMTDLEVKVDELKEIVMNEVNDSAAQPLSLPTHSHI